MRDIREKNTEAFLQDYGLFQKLASSAKNPVEENLPEGNTAPEKIQAHSFDTLLKKGEIRLLADTEKLTYAVILPWDWNHILLIPLSHFSSPAADDEFYAEEHDEKGLFLQVYQIWNIRTAAKSILSRSWRVGCISKEEEQRLRKMTAHYWFGKPLSEELENLSGLPITDRKDIRTVYRRNEEANLFELAQKDEAFEQFLQAVQTAAEVSASDGDDGKEKFRFVFKPELWESAAAAGTKKVSALYLQKDQLTLPLDTVESEDFIQLKPGEKVREMTWYSDNKKLIQHAWKPVVFTHRKSGGQLLGTGIVEKENEGVAITLRYPSDTAVAEPVLTPEDIIITVADI